MKTPTAALLLVVLSVAAPIMAQQPVDPKDVPQSVKDAQARAEAERMAKVNAQYPVKEHVPPTVRSTDADVQAFVKLLTGSFSSPAAGETPALTLSTSLMAIEGPGVDNAVYFELARADTPWQPFRQGVWQVWKKNGALMVRQYDFAGVPGTFKQAIAGFWAAPEVLPVLKSSQLAPVADIALASAGGNFSGTGSGPTLIDGAFEFSTSWVVTPETLSFTDRGTDVSGKQVWGPAQAQPARPSSAARPSRPSRSATAAWWSSTSSPPAPRSASSSSTVRPRARSSVTPTAAPSSTTPTRPTRARERSSPTAGATLRRLAFRAGTSAPWA
ncbi:MAG: CpcT/CpeT family chromophore lyase [Phycisphaerales bacterium]